MFLRCAACQSLDGDGGDGVGRRPQQQSAKCFPCHPGNVRGRSVAELKTLPRFCLGIRKVYDDVSEILESLLGGALPYLRGGARHLRERMRELGWRFDGRFTVEEACGRVEAWCRWSRGRGGCRGGLSRCLSGAGRGRRSFWS